MVSLYSIDKLIEQTRRLAAEYRRTTGQPLPVTAEIADYDACRLLDLELLQPPRAGFDAVGRSGERQGRRFQIKGRAIFDEKRSGQRIGQLKLEQEWDAVLLVLLDSEFEPFELYEASRAEVIAAVEEGSNRARRGAMSVARFRNIAHLVWARDGSPVEGEVWEHPGA